MGSKLSPKHHLPRASGRDHDRLHRGQEDLGICTALSRHRRHDTRERECPQDGHVVPLVEGFCRMDSFPWWGSGIMACHRDLHACLIQNKAIVGIKLPDFLLMEATLGLDLIAVTLGSVIRRFLRVSLRRTRGRCLLDRLGLTWPCSASR
jgi:hypothetical protein